LGGCFQHHVGICFYFCFSMIFCNKSFRICQREALNWNQFDYIVIYPDYFLCRPFRVSSFIVHWQKTKTILMYLFFSSSKSFDEFVFFFFWMCFFQWWCFCYWLATMTGQWTARVKSFIFFVESVHGRLPDGFVFKPKIRIWVNFGRP
jgi:hypothetical protein